MGCPYKRLTYIATNKIAKICKIYCWIKDQGTKSHILYSTFCVKQEINKNTHTHICIYIKKFQNSNQKLITLVVILGGGEELEIRQVDNRYMRVLTEYFLNVCFMNHINILSTQKHIKKQLVVKMTSHSFKIKTTVPLRSLSNTIDTCPY